MDSFLQKLRNFSLFEATVLAENLEMDLPACTSSHLLYPEHGNNVAVEVEKEFCQQLTSFSDESNWGVLQKQTDHASYHLRADGRTEPHFLLEGNRHNACDRNTHTDVYAESYVRYLSVRRFYSLFIKPTGDDDDKGRDVSTDEQKEMVEAYLDSLNHVSGDGFVRKWLGTPPEALKKGWLPKPIWITPAHEAPHRQPDFDSWSESERAREVVKQVALPGYTAEADRRDNIGIMAVEFDLVQHIDLYKPTVLDAIDASFFFPAPQSTVHGRTRILSNQLDRPTEQLGVKEYICQVFKVPVKLGEVIKVQKIGYF